MPLSGDSVSLSAVLEHWLTMRGRRGRDKMVVELTTTYALSAYQLVRIHSHDEVYSTQHYVIMFVGHLQQVGGFLRMFRFHLPIKQTATISFKYC